MKLNQIITSLKLTEYNDYTGIKYEESSITNNINAMELYKMLKNKNSITQKCREEYFKHFYSSVTSIFDKKLGIDDDSCSDEEGKLDNEIKICQIEEQSASEKDDSSKEQNGFYSTKISDVPYRFIVIPSYLYESHHIVYVSDIS